MNGIHIDFAPPSLFGYLHRLRPLSLLLIILLAISLTTLSLRLFKTYQVRQQLNEKVESREEALEKSKRRIERANLARQSAALSALEVAAMNQAIFRLNMPWTTLFDALQEAAVSDVAVLKLEPEVVSQSLTMSVESKSVDAMFKFIQKLGRQGFFKDVVLLKHEIIEPDPNKPVRFQVTSKWEHQK